MPKVTFELTEEQIKKLEKGEAVEIKQEVKESGSWFVPRKDQEYWFIGEEYNSHRLMIDSKIYQGDSDDETILATRQVYRTEQEAERALEVQKFKIKYFKWLAEKNGGWTPDWSDGNQRKFLLAWGNMQAKIFIDSCSYIQYLPDYYYAKSTEILKEAIEHFGDDLKMLFE